MADDLESRVDDLEHEIVELRKMVEMLAKQQDIRLDVSEGREFTTIGESAERVVTIQVIRECDDKVIAEDSIYTGDYN
jgi:hypothetical protein